MTTFQTKTVQIVTDGRQAVQDIRRALIGLYASVGADPSQPQEVARQFSLNRNLAWKLSKVINATDPFATLNHLPGQQGMDLAVQAFRKAGAPPALLSQLDGAIERFMRFVGVHAGDRGRFELMLESMGLFERETRAESGRELAFRGNSMIWGVQARVRIATMLLGPGASGKGDGILISGLAGFQRLRPTARWRLFRAQMVDDSGRPMLGAGMEEFEAKQSGETPMIIRKYSSPELPRIESARAPDGTDFFLPGGEVGNLGAFDCYFGYVFRGVPMARGPGNEYGSTSTAINLPAENLVHDLIVHKSLFPPLSPEVLVFGYPHGEPDNPAAREAEDMLPITESAVELAGPPPAVATPLIPNYPQLINAMYARMGWNPDEFWGVRVTMRFPPMNAKVVIRWPLAEG